MSDLILTIDSDDEQQPSLPIEDAVPTKQAKKSKAKLNGKSKVELKGKKRAREDDNELDGMDAGFQFDALGGGEMSSRKYGRRDAWASQICCSIASTCSYSS